MQTMAPLGASVLEPIPPSVMNAPANGGDATAPVATATETEKPEKKAKSKKTDKKTAAKDHPTEQIDSADLEKIKRAAARMEEVEDIEAEAFVLETDYLAKKAEAQAAKKNWKARVAQMRKVVREKNDLLFAPTLDSPKGSPLVPGGTAGSIKADIERNQMVKEAAAADADAWKTVRIDSLEPKLKPAKLKVLAEHNPPLLTLGDLTAFQADAGEWWWKQLTGFGDGGMEQLAAATDRYWAEHPQPKLEKKPVLTEQTIHAATEFDLEPGILAASCVPTLVAQVQAGKIPDIRAVEILKVLYVVVPPPINFSDDVYELRRLSETASGESAMLDPLLGATVRVDGDSWLIGHRDLSLLVSEPANPELVAGYKVTMEESHIDDVADDNDGDLVPLPKRPKRKPTKNAANKAAKKKRK